MMNILLINNHDSFVYNLYHLIKSEANNSKIDIIYNDAISLEQASSYERIVISPGPGIPSEAGNIIDIIQYLAPSTPILGVCLGHQAIAEAFGAQLYCMEKPLHGSKEQIQLTNHSGIFQDMPPTITVGRYHSWMVDKNTLGNTLKINTIDSRGEIMGIVHKQYPTYGVQFHPESIMTPMGKNIIANFLWNI